MTYISIIIKPAETKDPNIQVHLYVRKILSVSYSIC